MILSRVKLQGFRNFKKSVINLRKKSLIIGANDVGKTNLLWALRLLLDRGLSDYELDPKDSDFYAFEETNEFKILLRFEEVTDECVVSKMKGKISDDHVLLLSYHAYRDPVTKAKSYKLFAGSSEELLKEIEDRYYRKVLNLKYISSRRDFHNYIIREKSYLFETAKANRTDEEAEADEALYAEIQNELKTIDEKIPSLNFIASATDTINGELEKLSLHHQKQKVFFDATTSNADSFIKNVSISSKSNDQSILIGGDGRLNQIYLALWSSRNELSQEENLKEVTIFCIEEPEAHLHPHQQRKLADYLNLSLTGQVLLTSHSPQIASEFSPNSIVKLFGYKAATKAASKGCSDIIDEAFTDFGYRMSVIPAEAFFADVVLLVEGPSELIFYKTLAHQLEIDLDRLNISILMVDGIGFKTFIKILESLNIEWVLRTDNDIFKIPKKDEYRYAGIHRCISFYNAYYKDAGTDAILAAHGANITGFPMAEPEAINIDSAQRIIDELKGYDMFLSGKDLENDIFNSALKDDLTDYFEDHEEHEIVALMQKKKATFMYRFLRDNKESLKKLKDDDLAAPIFACQALIEDIQNEGN